MRRPYTPSVAASNPRLAVVGQDLETSQPLESCAGVLLGPPFRSAFEELDAVLRREKGAVFLAFIVAPTVKKVSSVECLRWNAKGILDDVNEAV